MNIAIAHGCGVARVLSGARTLPEAREFTEISDARARRLEDPAGGVRGFRSDSWGASLQQVRLDVVFGCDMCYTYVAMAAILDDLPPEELEFHWLGGRLSLDFVATVGERWRRSFERLRAPEDLARWIVATGMLETPPDVSARQLAAGRTLREAINRLARPGVEPDPGDREELNRWAARAPLSPRLTANGKLVWVSDRPVAAMFATIARDAVDLLSGPLAGRIRECSAADCALLFVDTSRPGRRRWCSTAACGNRVRTKAYRQRRKEAI